MIPSVKTRAGEAAVEDDNDEYELVQEWKTTIPNVAYTDKDKIDGIRDNIEYILRRHPFFLKVADFANANLYLRPGDCVFFPFSCCHKSFRVWNSITGVGYGGHYRFHVRNSGSFFFFVPLFV
jgi:hypothetical protein